MPRTESIDVAAVEHVLNGPPSDLSAAQPDERLQARREQPALEEFTWSQRVEIAGQEMKAMLMLRDGCEQRAQLEHAAPLGPRCVHGGEVQSENPAATAGQRNLEERVP